MTSGKVEELAAIWWQLAVGSPVPDSPVLDPPWQTSDRSRRRLAPFGEVLLPDFGFRVAKALGTPGRTTARGKVPAIGELLQGKEFRWIRALMGLLEERPATEGKDDEAVVRKARELHDDPESRLQLLALLSTPDATLESAARATGLDEPIIGAFADLFWNAIDRRREPLSRVILEQLLKAGPDPGTGKRWPTPWRQRLASAPETPVAVMARILRLKDPPADDREARHDSSGNKHHALIATLLLRSRPEAPDFKGRQEMIAEAEKALVLVREAQETTKPPPLFSEAYILATSSPITPIHEETAEDGKAPAEADDESPTEASDEGPDPSVPNWPPEPDPADLAELARRHQLPDSVERRDPLAVAVWRVTPGNRPPRLPGRAAFNWIRAAQQVLGGRLLKPVGGGGDDDPPWPTVLDWVRRAVEIETRPEARLLLRAALAAHDAAIDLVAANLGLNPGVVLAYRCLCAKPADPHAGPPGGLLRNRGAGALEPAMPDRNAAPLLRVAPDLTTRQVMDAALPQSVRRLDLPRLLETLVELHHQGRLIVPPDRRTELGRIVREASRKNSFVEEPTLSGMYPHFAEALEEAVENSLEIALQQKREDAGSSEEPRNDEPEA